MMLCNHPDFDYKHACFDAITAGSRSTARRTPTGSSARANRDAVGGEGIEDLREMKRLGSAA